MVRRCTTANQGGGSGEEKSNMGTGGDVSLSSYAAKQGLFLAGGHQVKGRFRPQPGAVSPPDHGRLPVIRVNPGVYFGSAAPSWWFLGCHGGAGASTLNAAILGGVDAGRYWPVPEPPGISRVVLAARTHAQGLRAV